jgi:hypothetical protein
MTVVLRGFDGKITQGTADTVLVSMTDWEFKMAQDYAEQGPFLSDNGNLYRSRTSKKGNGTIKGVVPSGKDASQTAIVTAFMAGNDIKTTLVSIGGYSIVVTAASFDDITLGHDAKGTATFEASFQDNGGWSVS